MTSRVTVGEATCDLQCSGFQNEVDTPNARLRELCIAFHLPPALPISDLPSLPKPRTSAFMIYSCVRKNCSIFCQRRVFLSIFPSLIASLVWMAPMSDAL
jgi:hypothetical protein